MAKVEVHDCYFNTSNEDVKEIAKAMLTLAEGLKILAGQVNKPQYGMYIEGDYKEAPK